MDDIKLRNHKAEAEYFRTLKLWRSACKRIDQYDEKALEFIWNQLESSWRKIGYIVGDPDVTARICYPIEEKKGE